MVKTLFVIDVQNDFCHSDGFFPKNFDSSTKGIDEIVDNVQKAINKWRESNLPVIYTQAIGDQNFLSKTQFNRYSAMGKLGFLQNDRWSSDFYKIKPIRGEPIFKKGGYDPFFNKEFRDFVISNVSSIVLTGFYSDVCVDATARSADQLGISTEIISDCSTSMFRNHEESLKFMSTYYGTKVLTLKEVLGDAKHLKTLPKVT